MCMFGKSSTVGKLARQNTIIIINIYIYTICITNYHHLSITMITSMMPTMMSTIQAKHERSAGADSYTVSQLAAGTQHQVVIIIMVMTMVVVVMVVLIVMVLILVMVVFQS